jgi:AraC-like DNA-binding protein
MEALVMKNVVSEWAESHFPLYTIGSIQSLYSTSSQPMHKIHESLNVILAIAGGKGTFRINDQTYELAEGSVILLPAQSHAALIGNLSQPLHTYMISISSQEQASPLSSGAMVQRSEIASRSSVLFFSHEPQIVADVEELYIHRLPANEARHVQNQMTFYRIILRLLEQQDAKYAASEQPSMERSITYLENHFGEKITREQLAAMAGISQSHYSILFRQLTGFTPNGYLSRLRVHRAKELLMSGSGTLREIAQKVGYKDEFYLSRRFKQQTGVSPSDYSGGSLQRIAVLLAPYASHLLLLGLVPSVIISESSEYLNTIDLPPPQSMMFINANGSAEQVRSVLLDNDIELIIAANEHMHQFGLPSGHLRGAAPIVEVPWMKMGWKDHLRLIAQAIQRSDRAEEWLAVFEKEEQAARAIVQKSGVANETFTILVIKPEELLVYGARNVGYVMYQSLGLQPPAKIGQELEKLGDEFHSVPIERSELVDYAGSRIFVIVFPDTKGSTAHAERIFLSSDWRELPAVRQNRVQRLDKDEWVPYNPVSIQLQLRRAVALFSDNQ